jgi:peptide/nickel transport system substrate-binding protein
VFSQATALDSAVASGGGTVGGSELQALYDSIMRFDVDTGKYVPQTAESLTPNADFTKWTLKLKPGITFTDGTPYNVQAVEFNFKRIITKQHPAAGFISRITAYKTVDDLTMEFTLNAPWSGFPYVFAYSTGAIASPTAIQKQGDNFGVNPVGAGAGPFVFDSFKPNEAIVLKRNPNYWGGAVYLDELRFVRLAGADATYEAVKAGTIQAGFLRDPAVVKRAQDDGYQGYLNLQWAGGLLLLNNGVAVTCNKGKPDALCSSMADGTKVPTVTPTSDKRVRQAIAAAIDVEKINQRVNNGKGYPGTELFQKSSKWYTGVAGPKYDPDAAKRLVSTVKAEGKWDGTLNFKCDNSPARRALAETVVPMLETVGFKVNLKNDYDISGVIQDVIVAKNYDMACWGHNIFEADPFVNLSQRFRSNTGSNFEGWVNPTVDKAIQDGGSVATDADRKANFEIFAKQIAEDVPSFIFEASPEFIVYGKNVRGVRPNITTIVNFGGAWLN